jgi:predicted transcriptional regulator
MTVVTLKCMKVAISVPDRVYRAADRMARRMRVPRSRVYVQALEAFLAAASEEDITRRLDEVYGQEAEPLDPFSLAAAKATLRRNK